ncbi:bifunctional triacylglycerol lipase/ester hydrolase SCDLUD_002381 [Saccharomycodes ludwigii]|uniref:bifunctional triacylglycerol lipase/ester hydrolase n=1 Tax=Saccharomycodes ludwigii TaxID=36035 RepID=UPI001E899396|nr:hypothetical protein SCDLUD_002381 [Saccharomycodes ludwigii]KAH3900921.1 hypothetical protein SCDLUD_002381 [Saccharomycodes ludwigii]
MFKTVLTEKKELVNIFHYTPSIVNGNTPLVIFVPGNPGIINFYSNFLRSLVEKYPKYEIYGLSHRGFTGGDSNFGELYDLNQQVENTRFLLSNILNDRKGANDNNNTQRPLILMGHSMGCYVLQKNIIENYQLNYKKIIFFMPTIVDIHKSEAGSKLNLVFKILPAFYLLVGGLVTLAINWLKLGWVFQIISKKFYEGYVIQNQIYDFITSSYFTKQALYLAKHEMNQIRDQWKDQHIFKNIIIGNNKDIFEMWFAGKDHRTFISIA